MTGRLAPLLRVLAKDVGCALLFGFALWTVGALAGIVAVGFCMVASCR